MKSLQSELEGQKKRRVFETRPFRLDAPIRLARAWTDEEEKEGDDDSNLSCVLRLASHHRGGTAPTASTKLAARHSSRDIFL
jgi:hypothetical protein